MNMSEDFLEKKPKKVGIITFHASHNYGSMLQTYALQTTIEKMGYECEVINYRTPKQREFYKPLFKKGNLYERLKRYILQFKFIKDINKKYDLFEEFLRNDIRTTKKEFTNELELIKADLDFDYYISGSDQIWNTLILDFDWVYLLSFVKKGRKVAYAPSLGPTPELMLEDYEKQMISLLNDYDAISVREERSAKYISSIMGYNPDIVLDPTLLLDRSEWDNLAGEHPIIEGDYCFCYSPWMNERVLECSCEWAKKNNMRVVLSKPLHYLSSTIKWSKQIETHAAVGPKEFLNICKFAKMVCCDSFHAVVFSIIFNTQFMAVDGDCDSRISNLFDITRIEGRSVYPNCAYKLNDLDYKNALNGIDRCRKFSLNWLFESLNK